MIKKSLKALFIGFCFMFGMNAFGADRAYILTTASTGGTYYPVGVALATLVKIQLQPKQKIGMSAINSAGSGENVKLLREDEAQFGILQGLYGYFAKTGSGPLKNDGPQERLRSVTMLWPNVEHFVINSEFAKTGTATDFQNIKGKVAGLGKKNSGTLGSNKVLLGNLGLDIDKDFELFHQGYGPSADALANGKVQGISTPAGDPVSAIAKLFASKGDKVTILQFPPELAKKADGGMGLWVPYEIAGGTYPGLDKKIHTIAQPNFLAVRDSVNEDDVYLITKTIYANLKFLSSIHKATSKMSLDKALAGLPIKLHPGALRFYEEAGVKIPASLK